MRLANTIGALNPNELDLLPLLGLPSGIARAHPGVVIALVLTRKLERPQSQVPGAVYARDDGTGPRLFDPASHPRRDDVGLLVKGTFGSVNVNFGAALVFHRRNRSTAPRAGWGYELVPRVECLE